MTYRLKKSGPYRNIHTEIFGTAPTTVRQTGGITNSRIIRFQRQCKHRALVWNTYKRAIATTRRGVRTSPSVDDATPNVELWHRRAVVTHKSLFAGIFIYGRRAFDRAAETQPWKYRLNFQTISQQLRRPLPRGVRERRLCGGFSQLTDSTMSRYRGLGRGVVNGKPLFSNQIICSTLGREMRRRGKRWLRMAGEQVFLRSTLPLASLRRSVFHCLICF